VTILFLPIVCADTLISLLDCTDLWAVLHALWSPNELGAVEQRHYMGLYRHYLLGRLCIEILRLRRSSARLWIQLERVRCHWLVDELQRVRIKFFLWITIADEKPSLVELIVLNIGLQAKILDGRTFSMFVVHALVLTFITTPLTLLFYSPKHRKGRFEKKPAGDEASTAPVSDGDDTKSRLALVLDKVEQIPAAMTFSQLFTNSSLSTNRSKSDEKADDAIPIDVKVLRLMELTNRTSAVLRSQESESLIHNDPVVNIYRTFGKLNSIGVSASLSVVNHDEFADAVAAHASETASQMVVIPWPRGVTSVAEGESVTRNPFDGAFHKTTTEDQTTSVVYSEYIRNVFAKSPVDVALFVERGSSSHSSNNSFHLFLPFFGGPDDRAALSLVDQLCENPAVSATVVKIVKTDSIDASDAAVVTSPAAQTVSTCGQPLQLKLITSCNSPLPPWIPFTQPTIHRRASHPTPLITSSGSKFRAIPPRRESSSALSTAQTRSIMSLSS